MSAVALHEKLFFNPEKPNSFLTSHLTTTPGQQPAVIICPGGAYGLLAEHEGSHYAEWLVSLGIHAFVLNYQLGAYPGGVRDLADALHFLSNHADSFGINSQRIGLVGSSAGAHLITTLYNANTRSLLNSEVPRVNLAVLCYPLISMVTHVHQKSCANLIADADPDLPMQLSAEHAVTNDFPPAFIWHTCEDRSVTPNHSLLFSTRLASLGVPFELHIFETGGHGLGLQTQHPWPRLCEQWFKQRGFI